MTIAFSCPRCAMHFKVPDRVAGKDARCKKCGHVMKVPDVTAPVGAPSGMFRLGTVEPDVPGQASGGKEVHAKAGRPSMPRHIRLAPVSEALIAPIAPELAPLLGDSDSGDYEIEQSRRSSMVNGTGRARGLRRSGPARPGVFEYAILLLRKISDFAYLISVPLLLLMLLAIILKERNLAFGTAALVILLNIGRLAVDGLALIALAFKNGPLQGILFFVPPFTFYYLRKRGRVMKEALARFLGPAVPIICVILLFVFIPWLRAQ